MSENYFSYFFIAGGGGLCLVGFDPRSTAPAACLAHQVASRPSRYIHELCKHTLILHDAHVHNVDIYKPLPSDWLNE